jgi:hypothetical protein
MSSSSGFRKEVESADVIRKSVDMDDEQFQDLVDVARRALTQHELEKDVAREIKTYLDSKYVASDSTYTFNNQVLLSLE